MFRLLRLLLLPVTAIYSLIVYLRNRFYDWGILKSELGSKPTIVIGNLALGGTGKTPMTEYLLRLLSPKINIAVLSRGYGRKTKGFILAGPESTSDEIGDEPKQIQQKFPQIPVAVCENRIEGIEQLDRQLPGIQLVVLDDAFQHRPLKPDLSILLTSYHKPYWDDIMLPTGYLRDNVAEKSRADIIIVTKCPQNLDETEKKEIIQTIYPSKRQKVFFSTITYGEPVWMSGPKVNFDKNIKIRGMCAIANPEVFENHLKTSYSLVSFKTFRDHHIFSHSELNLISTESGKFDEDFLPLLITEKDAMKLKNLEPELKIPIYYVPIQMEILWEKIEFEKMILELSQEIIKG